MASSSAARRSSLPRFTLRAGLLAGALLDAILALASPTVSYPPLGLPVLALRALLQGVSCYDLHRYGQVLPWAASSLLATAALAWGAAGRPSWAALYAAIGLTQLAAWRVVRP
jgi:hypothetical protein